LRPGVGVLGGLELLEQGQRLTAHSLLHHWQLMQPGPAEDRLEPNSGGHNPPLPTSAPQRSLQLWPSQVRRRHCSEILM